MNNAVIVDVLVAAVCVSFTPVRFKVLPSYKMETSEPVEIYQNKFKINQIIYQDHYLTSYRVSACY